MRAAVAGVLTAATIALTGAVLAGAGSSPASRSAQATPVPSESLSGFVHPITTTTAPARHIAALGPSMKYQKPAEFKGRHRVPKLYATTMAPVTTRAPTTTTTTPVVISDATSVETPDWVCVRQAESGYPNGNYDEQVGLGGAYEIMPYVWQGTLGYSGYAFEYPPAVQDAAALRLYHMFGWSPWSADYWHCPFV